MTIKNARQSRGLVSTDPLVRDSLRQLPDRRLAEPEAVSRSGGKWERVDFDRYEIRNGDETVGYVEAVGAVFVALRGPDYARSVEILQTLVFERAVEAVTGVYGARDVGATEA
ncbi:hypothetical protein IC744_01845 [Microbacterium hominis]|uniref:hypothetical protein n=1 Tax=Microbacterium hominis TaxID=162426 RepID=UPI00168B4533|nr:hypothetical protein [Microbacterium hominis]QOC25161.1 hypothetical protein IC745_12495 [Microbacterium hominis]QOC29196.1 hypothetical protein IC744_01845 [Microbacterium hominis]